MLDTLLNRIQKTKPSDTTLYFISRALKPEINKADKVLDKYEFKVYQIDVNDEIRSHLYDLTVEQLGFLISKNYDTGEYDVVSDDTEQLITYSMKNKAMSFSDVVNNQLKSKVPKITSLEDILQTEDLWAYSVGFYLGKNEQIYTFRKMLKGKVAIDENDSNTKTKTQKILRTIFNVKSKRLELIHGETVSLDKQLDCIFYVDTFYVLRKTQFEQIVGLEEEYKEQAYAIVHELKSTKMIEGVELLHEKVSTTPAIHKKLVRLSKVGNYQNLDKATIKKMAKVAKLFGNKLKIKNDKLLIEDEQDIDLALKMLADYFKEGKVSGKSYGTYAGREIQPVS